MSNTEKRLQEAEYFFKRIQETHAIPFEFECNLQAFITFARSVTSIMQNDYSEKPNFKVWYQKKREEMQNDEMLRFFNEARVIAIHEKPLSIGTIVHMREVYIHSIPHGWNLVTTGKGEPIWITPRGEEVHAFEFDNQVNRVYVFNDPPKIFLGTELKDFSVVTLCKLYLTYLSDLVKEVGEEFGERKEREQI